MEKQNPPKAPLRRRFQQRPHPRHPNSTKSAYILVLGPTNSGKSKTINALFNHRQICEVSSNEGTTRIQEYSTNLRAQRNLKIVDTPGLSRDKNTVWDTRVLATIKKYLDTDPDLQNCIPNVILIVGRFDDEKLSDPTGPFVRSLQAINLLNCRLFDKFSCNVVVLLTHFDEGIPEYRNNPKFRQDEIMDLIKMYTQFPQMPYIIFGENNSSRNSPFVTHELYGGQCSKVGVNGGENENESIYPANLMDLIVKISAGSTKGAMGPDFFRNVFVRRESIFLWKSGVLSLVASDRKRFRRAFYALKDVFSENEESSDGKIGNEETNVLSQEEEEEFCV